MSARRIGLFVLLVAVGLAAPAFAQSTSGGMSPDGIANEPPEVELFVPTAGQQFVVGTSMTMQATAFDADDGINQVTFLIDGATVATDLTDDYAGTWTVTTGNHTVAARATDNRGKSTTTTAITITGVPNTPPTVSLTAPTAGSTYTVGTAVPMTATASDSDGTINRVEFWVDGTKKGQDTTSPYAYSGWITTAGDHAVQAKAVDDLGATTSTSAINIHGNYLPTVSLTGPAAGATYTVGTAVPMSATASDSDGTINRVEFWVDGTKVGQDASSPYTYNSWIATAGDHAVQAKAFDNRGGMTSTSAINIHGNFLPTVSLTGPVGGASYSPGGAVVMSATASDSDGTINRVEFWVDGAKVDQDASSPYSRNWIATTVGNHTVEAKAFDNRSGMTGSGPVTIHVANTPPTVSLTAPAANAYITTGTPITMAATASDSDGTINRVEFWLDGAKLGQDTSSPYTYDWTVTAGPHTVQAKSVDNLGATTSTSTITIHGNNPPSAGLTTPGNGDTYASGTPITMAATASDSDGTINRVEFWVDGAKVDQDASSPYSRNWIATTAGNHTVESRSFDDHGAMTASPTANITVTESPTNTPPTVSLTKPTNGQTFPVGNIPFTATAGDSDGTVDHVEFWVGVNKVNQDTTSPYTYDWPATAGDYDVLAKSVDNLGATTSTSAITIHVVANTPPTISLTKPTNGQTFPVGDVPFAASAGDSDGTVDHVEFWVGASKVNQDTASPYAYDWPATAGDYDVLAKSVDNLGATTSTSAITIHVVANTPPTVSLMAPANDASYDSGDIVTLSATASDIDGTIDHVQFLVDGTEITQDGSSPYGTTWTATSGSHNLSAVAVDNGGTSSTPDDAAIMVTTPPPPPQARLYTYNSYQELCSVEEPETGVTLMGYDLGGNLWWSASGLPSGTACSSSGNTTAINARKVKRTYDSRNRITLLEFPDFNGDQEWTYTPDGLPDSVTTTNDAGASSVTNTYAYNHRRLLIGESQQADSNNWSVGYGFDANASLSTVVYPDSLTVAYAPNALGQPTQAGTYATGVQYYPNGAIQQFTYGNGIVHSLTQNARGLPDISRDADGATAVHHDEYTYDKVGNVLYIVDGVAGGRGDRDMSYDALNRLTQVVSPAVSPAVFGTATYTYDVLDNLTHVHVTGGSQARDQEYVYDQHNRLTNLMEGGASVVGLGYDVQGNLANKNGTFYTFDYGNRLRAGGPETYRYDVQGRRFRSSSTAGVVYSLYAQSGQLLFQRDERSAKRRQYVYLGGSLVAESDVPLAGGSATVTYQHTDALGSPVATTNSAKAVLQRSEYEPYGYLLNRPMQDGPGYTGHVTDAATGLVYMQQRYYDPGLGVFPTTDPVTPFSAGGAFNRYWYGAANPYRFTDPDGRSPNEVYLISGGGEWQSGQTVSAGEKHRTSTATASSTGAPTEQINRWMNSKDANDRLKAAFAAIKIFKIRTHGEVLKVTPKYPRDSGIHGENQVVLYGGAFSSWSWLGTTLGHEFEGHYDNLGYSAPEIAESEVRAYRYSLDSVNRFGDSPREVNQLEASYESWLKEYESWKQYQGEW